MATNDTEPFGEGVCDNCKDEPATDEVAVLIGGTPVGAIQVCETCREELD